MVVGLAVTVAWVLWERMHLRRPVRLRRPTTASPARSRPCTRGGAFIECYLAVASAFALGSVFTARRLVVPGAGAAGAGGGRLRGHGDVLAQRLCRLRRRPGVRPGAAALGVASRRRLPGAALTTGVVLLLVAAVAVPVLGGSFARERLAQTSRDLAVRQAHWADALQLRQDDAWTWAFGEGLGRFPQAHYWRSREPRRAASYALVREGNDASCAWARRHAVCRAGGVARAGRRVDAERGVALVASAGRTRQSACATSPR